LTESSEHTARGPKESLLSAVSTGAFFILIGIIFAMKPNLFNNIIDFFQDFSMVNVPNTENFVLPAPEIPGDHLAVYSAVGLFSLIWGSFEIFMLALRFVIKSPLNKKAETASNIVFWLGASYLINVFLNDSLTMTLWFAFWAVLIMLIGLTFVIRAIILAVRR